MGVTAGRLREGRLSSIEAGLLTVADRRGRVSAPRVIDERNDPGGAARSEMLSRLQNAGLLKPLRVDGPTDDDWFVITEAGRAALTALDNRSKR